MTREQMQTEMIGKKCKWKNQICDGLCNNCYALADSDSRDKYKIAPAKNWWSDSIYNGSPDYEGAILARQEMMDY